MISTLPRGAGLNGGDLMEKNVTDILRDLVHECIKEMHVELEASDLPCDACKGCEILFDICEAWLEIEPDFIWDFLRKKL